MKEALKPAEEFGDKVSEAEQQGQKSEIVRSGIESITNELELTTEQGRKY
ncbi:hypothetical protein OFR26_13965 [Brachyspira hyodysenteriae]|nr:hypothetical protein [Brachyspira hyodysenteriae]MDA0016456.1 hypothetical protein [Brachyspira hyodysenteriae]